MAVNLVSPGVKIREVDLTRGSISQSNDQIGAFAGPFSKGPVGVPVLIQNEQQLLEIFGKPSTTNNQNEYWLHASNYLSYGGILQVVRVGSGATDSMTNSYVGVSTLPTVRINSVEDYTNRSTNDAFTSFYYAAKNPGAWANNLTVYTIDSAADQIIGIETTGLGVSVGSGVSIAVSNRVYAGIGATATFNGYLKGIITGIGNSSLDIKLVSRHSNDNAIAEFIDYSESNPLDSIQGSDTIQIMDQSGVGIGTTTIY
ncbi:MAG: hypothetical protein MUP85_22970, partial [Candidatus Lokiarchaeota archaeon]|nr:hypothetical protein [Candidatus Lokiarchaeota archaeon]